MNIVYARVSTSDQTCEPQLLELRDYAFQRKLVIDLEITDVISGSKGSREGLDRLMTLIRSGKVRAVLCVKLDRVARSVSHFARIVDELAKYKVALIVPRQNIDTSDSNPASRFMLTILSAVAELERDMIRERTKAGLVVARANGKVIGQTSKKMPPVPERQRIIRAHRAAYGDTEYRILGLALGGVSPASAWRAAKTVPHAPEAETIEV